MMLTTVQSTPLGGLYLIEPTSSHDMRGVTRTGYHPTQYASFGMTGRFTSDRHVRSFQGTLRGLYIIPEGQSLLFTLVRGDVALAVVDMRPGSKTFGKFEMIDLTEAQHRKVYISGGLAYGYCVRDAIADVHENYTGFFEDGCFDGLFWKDANLSIPWPVKFPLISEEENRFPALAHYLTECV